MDPQTLNTIESVAIKMRCQAEQKAAESRHERVNRFLSLITPDPHLRAALATVSKPERDETYFNLLIELPGHHPIIVDPIGSLREEDDLTFAYRTRSLLRGTQTHWCADFHEAVIRSKK